VVEQNDEALAEGMRSFLRGEVAPTFLDVDSYNHEAIEEFRAAVAHQEYSGASSR
jgi:CDP-glycerol glycerophosphotransferase